MRGIVIVGVLLLVLGALSFVVPIPHTQDHSVRVGDARIGVQTHSSDKIPPVASFVLLGAGVLTLALGARKG